MGSKGRTKHGIWRIQRDVHAELVDGLCDEPVATDADGLRLRFWPQRPAGGSAGGRRGDSWSLRCALPELSRTACKQTVAQLLTGCLCKNRHSNELVCYSISSNQKDETALDEVFLE